MRKIARSTTLMRAAGDLRRSAARYFQALGGDPESADWQMRVVAAESAMQEAARRFVRAEGSGS